MTESDLPWHALLAPLPANVPIQRRPVASPEVLATEHGAGLAGMEQIVAELSAGERGLRIAMIVVKRGRLMSISDSVMSNLAATVRAGSGTVRAVIVDSIGGSIATDGSIRGTRWRSRTVDDEKATIEEPGMESEPSQLTEDDVTRLRALGAQLLSRVSDSAQPPREE